MESALIFAARLVGFALVLSWLCFVNGMSRISVWLEPKASGAAWQPRTDTQRPRYFGWGIYDVDRAPCAERR